MSVLAFYGSPSGGPIKSRFLRLDGGTKKDPLETFGGDMSLYWSGVACVGGIGNLGSLLTHCEIAGTIWEAVFGVSRLD